MNTAQPTTPGTAALLEAVARRAEASGVFGAVGIRDGQLVCRALDSAAPASYRLRVEGGRLWVSLVMSDRWLSESIEADLMHTGDKVEELLEEELVELGVQGVSLPVEHFRSDDLLFTFRSAVPGGGSPDAGLAGACVLAYEACFRNLGDMAAGDGDD